MGMKSMIQGHVKDSSRAGFYTVTHMHCF